MASQPHNDWQSVKRTVLERSCHMFNNPLMSDIALTCGQSTMPCFYAHKYVLATSSPVFYAMFYGDLAEKNSVIHLPDVDEESLREFLCFLYTDQCTLTPDIVVKVMYLAKKYIVPALAEKCLEVLRRCMNPENVLAILEQMILFDEAEMVKKCWDIVDMHTIETVSSEVFVDLEHETLDTLLKRNTLNIPEIELFHAVLNWLEHQCWLNGVEGNHENMRAFLGCSVHQLRFLSMTKNEFLHYVSPSGLLTRDESDAILERFNNSLEPCVQSQQPKTQVYSGDLQCITRFSYDNIKSPTSAWSYGDKPDKLSFTVNFPAVLHGVRLFGDAKGSEYQVSLEVNGSNVSGTYISELQEQGVYGFDVMLATPVPVCPDVPVTIVALVKGPNSYYGNDGLARVDVAGVTVVFGNASGASNGTGVRQGQFQQIMLSF